MEHDQVVCIGFLGSGPQRKGKKSYGKKIILVAAKHNLREIAAEQGAHGDIDASRIHLNRVLRGATTAIEVAREAEDLIAAGTEKVRSNATLGIEIVFSLPIDARVDAMKFFADALAWTDEFFKLPVVSAVAHFDQSGPHMHVIFLPIVDGKLQGSAVAGNKKRLEAMQADFHEKVGSKHGLRRKMSLKAFNHVDRRIAAEKIVDAFIANPALLQGGMSRNALLKMIQRDPEPLMIPLAIPMPTPKPSKQTFAGIMTKPVQRIDDDTSAIGHSKNSYRTLPDSEPEKHEVLSCVGVSVPDASIDAAIDQSADSLGASNDDFIRVRDADLNAGWWDETRGEFVQYAAR